MRRIVLVSASLLLLAGLMVSVGGQAEATRPGTETDTRVALVSDGTQVVARTAPEPATQAVPSAWQRHGFLLGALLVMTTIMIVTHHRQHRDETGEAGGSEG